MNEGILYVIGTPLGNPDDVTLRAIDVLKEVDSVYAEDTRVTGRLFRHHGIKTRLMSLYEHNEERKLDSVIEQLKAGDNIALVSSAGTPGLSDPGYRLISAAVREDITVTPIPGPAALIAALSASGLAMERFCFSSFLPRRGEKRVRRLATLAAFPGSVAIYESPHRLAQLCRQAIPLFGDRNAVVAREPVSYTHLRAHET